MCPLGRVIHIEEAQDPVAPRSNVQLAPQTRRTVLAREAGTAVHERQRFSGWLVYGHERVQTPTERDVFFELNLPVIAPELRSEASLDEAITAGRAGAVRAHEPDTAPV